MVREFMAGSFSRIALLRDHSSESTPFSMRENKLGHRYQQLQPRLVRSRPSSHGKVTQWETRASLCTGSHRIFTLPSRDSAVRLRPCVCQQEMTISMKGLIVSTVELFHSLPPLLTPALTIRVSFFPWISRIMTVETSQYPSTARLNHVVEPRSAKSAGSNATLDMNRPIP